MFEEKFYQNASIESFRNYYEQSKRYAENVVQRYIESDSLNGHVIRLSQVVGDYDTGVTITDYGIFDFVKRLKVLSRRYPNSTVRIKIDPESTQNFVSINKVISCLMRFLAMDKVPLIVNIVGKISVKNDSIVKNICNLLPITIIQDEMLDSEYLSVNERIIAAGMSFTGEYTCTDLLFDCKNLDNYSISNEHEVTSQSLNKMLEYYITNLSK